MSGWRPSPSVQKRLRSDSLSLFCSFTRAPPGPRSSPAQRTSDSLDRDSHGGAGYKRGVLLFRVLRRAAGDENVHHGDHHGASEAA